MIAAATIAAVSAPVNARPEWLRGVVGAAVDTMVPPSGVNTTFEGGVEFPPVESPPVELPPVDAPSVVVVVVSDGPVVVVVVGFDGSVVVVVVGFD